MEQYKNVQKVTSKMEEKKMGRSRRKGKNNPFESAYTKPGTLNR